jgi:hypothetical protein
MPVVSAVGEFPAVNIMAEKYSDVPRHIILKLDLLRRGARLTEAALDGVQTDGYRFGPMKVFYFTRESQLTDKENPGSILLRDGTTASVAFDETNDGVGEPPYVIDWDGESFSLYDGEVFIDTVDFTPRPKYFGKRTSRGTLMEQVANARAQRLIINTYSHCHLWDTGDQCRYCSFFTDLIKAKKSAEDRPASKEVNPEDIYETVREVLKEPGRISEIYLTGGLDYSGEPMFENEVNRYIRALQAIGRNFKGRFSSQIMAPAYSKEQLRRIYDETGLTSYCPNIEVWDDAVSKWICPGKNRWPGNKEWIRRTLDAVEIFGWGHVYTQVVAGVELCQPHGFKTEDEALASNLEACEFYSKHGVVFVSTVWRPNKHASLGEQPIPSLDFYVRLTRGLHEIRKSYGLTADNDDYKHCGNHADADLERGD